MAFATRIPFIVTNDGIEILTDYPHDLASLTISG